MKPFRMRKKRAKNPTKFLRFRTLQGGVGGLEARYPMDVSIPDARVAQG